MYTECRYETNQMGRLDRKIYYILVLYEPVYKPQYIFWIEMCRNKADSSNILW